MLSFSLIVFGTLWGIRHALEPDHLAAVSTLVAEERSVRSATALGAFWGVGHTLALMLVSCALAWLGTSMPPRLAAGLEAAVGVMLTILGARSLWRARRGPRPHRHVRSLLFVDDHAADGHVHFGRWTFGQRSLVVGLIHGLAGSGAVTALVASELATFWGRLGYIALFGLGSMAAMAALSGAVGWPLARLLRDPRAERLLRLATGSFAIGMGLLWLWPLLKNGLP